MSEIDDPARLRAIADLDLTRPEVHAELDALASRAAAQLGLPIGLVSIVLDGAQWFPGHHGLTGWLVEVGGTPVEWSFCRNVVEKHAPLQVPDATADARFADNPLVTRDGVRCYLGVPLTTRDGHVVGSLCVIGDKPRETSPEDVAALQELARGMMERLQTRA